MPAAMNDREFSRFMFRMGLFKRRGWSEEVAEQFADKTLARDRDGDDRKACIECKNLQRGGTCFEAAQGRIAGADRRLTPVQNIFQRCERFTWATPA